VMLQAFPGQLQTIFRVDQHFTAAGRGFRFTSMTSSCSCTSTCVAARR
jgi:hypothetical protein